WSLSASGDHHSRSNRILDVDCHGCAGRIVFLVYRIVEIVRSLMPLDLLNLLFIPLMLITARELKQNWASLWDQQLTARDRYLLQRLVIFWLLPVVVMCHELGHVAAVNLFGGKVHEFHYAFVWGYVVPQGTFTPDQVVWLY